MSRGISASVYSVLGNAPVRQEGAERRLISDRVPGWPLRAQNRLSQLMRLNKGWDGYNGKPLAPETAYFAMHVLLQVCTERTPVPHLVPTSNGGVQIEWHKGACSLEIMIRRPNSVEVWSLGSDGVELELDLNYRMDLLIPLVRCFDSD